MTDATASRLITLDQAREVRRRILDCIGEQMSTLGTDPRERQAATMTGLEYYERWLRPADMAPPPAIAILFSMEWVEVEPSRAVLGLVPVEWMFNALGMIHGGIAATLLDTVMGAAIHTTLPAGTGLATTDLQVRYIRAMNPDTGRVIATGNAVHSGRRQGAAEGRVEVESTGKLIATATAGLTIFRPS